LHEKGRFLEIGRIKVIASAVKPSFGKNPELTAVCVASAVGLYPAAGYAMIRFMMD